MIKYILTFGVGLAAGAAGGIFYMKEKYDDRINEELSKLRREYYEGMGKAFLKGLRGGLELDDATEETEPHNDKDKEFEAVKKRMEEYNQIVKNYVEERIRIVPIEDVENDKFGEVDIVDLAYVSDRDEFYQNGEVIDARDILGGCFDVIRATDEETEIMVLNEDLNTVFDIEVMY